MRISQVDANLDLSLVASFRPYRMHAFLLVYTPALLFVDGSSARRTPQLILGLLTFGVLAACARRPRRRRTSGRR